MRRMSVVDLIVAGIMVGEFTLDELMEFAKNNKMEDADTSEKFVRFNSGYENLFYACIKRLIKYGYGKKYDSIEVFTANIHDILAKHLPDITPNQIFNLAPNTKIYEENFILEGAEDSKDKVVYEQISVAALESLIQIKEISKVSKIENITQEDIDEYKKLIKEEVGELCLNMKWN